MRAAGTARPGDRDAPATTGRGYARMDRPHRLGALAFAAVMLALLALPGPATAARGKLHVVITTPEGVPANVVARGPKRKVVAKGVAGKQFGATIPAPAGRFRIAPQPVLSGGVLYTGRATPRRVRVRAGRTANVRVRYRRARSARALRPVAARPDEHRAAVEGPAQGALRAAARDRRGRPGDPPRREARRRHGDPRGRPGPGRPARRTPTRCSPASRAAGPGR